MLPSIDTRREPSSEGSFHLKKMGSGTISAVEYAADETGGHKKQLIYEQRIWSPYHQEGFENGDAFYGTKGMMILGKSGGWHVVLERDKPGPSMKGTLSLIDHHQNFLDCVRGGGQPHADVEIGHLSAGLCHLANIATRTGSAVRFDPATETVIGNPAAAPMIGRTYRPGHWPSRDRMCLRMRDRHLASADSPERHLAATRGTRSGRSRPAGCR